MFLSSVNIDTFLSEIFKDIYDKKKIVTVLSHLGFSLHGVMQNGELILG